MNKEEILELIGDEAEIDEELLREFSNGREEGEEDEQQQLGESEDH